MHDDYFPVDAEDRHWLREVGRRGWIVISKDKHFQHRELEIAAIADANVRVYKITGGNMQGSEIAELLANHLSKLVRFAKGNPPPFIANVSRSGRISLVFSARKLRKYRSLSTK